MLYFLRLFQVTQTKTHISIFLILVGKFHTFARAQAAPPRTPGLAGPRSPLRPGAAAGRSRRGPR